MVGGEEGKGVDEEDEAEEKTEGAEDAGAGGEAEGGAGHGGVIDRGLMGGTALWSRDGDAWARMVRLKSFGLLMLEAQRGNFGSIMISVQHCLRTVQDN